MSLPVVQTQTYLTETYPLGKDLCV